MLKVRPFLLVLAVLMTAAVPTLAQDSTVEPTEETAPAEANEEVQTAHVRVAHLSPTPHRSTFTSTVRRATFKQLPTRRLLDGLKSQLAHTASSLCRLSKTSTLR